MIQLVLQIDYVDGRARTEVISDASGMHSAAPPPGPPLAAAVAVASSGDSAGEASPDSGSQDGGSSSNKVSLYNNYKLTHLVGEFSWSSH